MATVTGITAERAEEILGESIVSGEIVGGSLILTKDNGGTVNAGVVSSTPDATTTVKGIVELATSSEVVAGTDAVRAVTPATLKVVTDELAPEAHTHPPTRTAIIVAAYNAPSDWIAAAAYDCDGTNDHVQIQMALDEYQTTKTPLVFSPGDFWVGAPLELDDAVQLSGSGMDITWFRAHDGLNDYVMKFLKAGGDGTISARLSDFSIDGRCAEQTAGGGIDAMGAVECHFERIHVINSFNWGLALRGMTTGGFGHNNRVYGCHFNATITSNGYGGAVWLTSNDENDLRGCTFQFLGGDLAPVGSLPVAVLDQGSINNFVGCTWVGAQAGTNCIHLRLHDTKISKVNHCMFDGSGGDAIFVTGSGHLIEGNTIVSPGDQGTAGAYSGIHLEYAARGVSVIGNSLETSPTAGATRSLIRERGDGDAGGNIIIGNTLKQNGVGTPGTAFYEFGGLRSVYSRNIINVALVETMFPAEGHYQYNGTAYVRAATGAALYTGTADPGAVADGSVWIDRTAHAVKVREAGAWAAM